MYMNTL